MTVSHLCTLLALAAAALLAAATGGCGYACGPETAAPPKQVHSPLRSAVGDTVSDTAGRLVAVLLCPRSWDWLAEPAAPAISRAEPARVRPRGRPADRPPRPKPEAAEPALPAGPPSAPAVTGRRPAPAAYGPTTPNRFGERFGEVWR